MGKEREPFADGEPSGTLAGDTDREAFEVDVGDLDADKLRSAQAAGDAQGEDAQIPAMDEQGEPVRFLAAAQPLATTVTLTYAGPSPAIVTFPATVTINAFVTIATFTVTALESTP